MDTLPTGYHTGLNRLVTNLVASCFGGQSRRIKKFRSNRTRYGDYYSNLAVSEELAVESRRVHTTKRKFYATRWEELAITELQSLWKTP